MANKNVVLKNGSDILYPQTKTENILDLASLDVGDLGSGNADTDTVLLADGEGGTSWGDLTHYGFVKNPMSAQGDVMYGGTFGAPTRLAKGTAGQVLTMNSGATAPEWATPASGGMANPMTAAGDIITGGNSGSPTRLGIGSNGQVLTSNGSSVSWQTPAASGMTNPMTTAGDIITGGNSGAPTRLGIGSNGQVLTSNGSSVSWQTPAASGMTNPMTAYGDIIYGGASGTPLALSKGTAGQVLQMDSLGTSPEWVTNTQGTAGDTLAASASSASAGQVLTADGGGGTSWTTPANPGMSNPMSAQGDIIIGGSSGTPTRLAGGTAGQFLTMNSGATAPQWTTLAGIPYTTTAPTAANTDGTLHFVVLAAEPATYYNGYYYIITGA